MESKTKNLAIEGMVRDNIDVREMGLTFVGKEYSTPLGRIDILAADSDGNKIPIEIKIGCAGDSAVGQLLGYMKAVGADEGIIMANEFTKRVEAVAGSLNIELYTYQLDVIMSGMSDHVSYSSDYDDYIHDNRFEDEFIRKYCDVEPGRMIAVEVLSAVYNSWFTYNHGPYHPPNNLEHFIQHHYGVQTIEVGVGGDEGDGPNIGDSWIAGTSPFINPMAYDGVCLKHTFGNIHEDLAYINKHWDELKLWD